MNIVEVKKINIPQKPGSYQFLNKDGEIIYIGKAVNLYFRVLSYWRKSAGHSAAKYAMLKQIYKIKWIETDSEIEALLLEANLIKKHQPNFNVSLRDDKRYVYIKISIEDEFPRIFVTRKLDRRGRYFGPFVSTESVRETLKTLRKVWPFRACAHLPKRACLYFHLGKCSAPCENRIEKKEYNKMVCDVTLFLEGRKKKVLIDISKEIKNIELKIKNKKIEQSELERLEKMKNNLKFRFLNINKVLSEANVLGKVDKYASDVIELAKVLNLSRVPNRIEGYDISGAYGKHLVSSMVVFEGGEPNKSEYKKFKIKDQNLRADVWMLNEVLNRRFKHSLDVSQEKDIWPLPDLLIIDGARAQLNVISKILKKNNLDIPAIAISKGASLRSARARDKIYFPGESKPLELSLHSPALHLIKRVRDESHRFAIAYYKKLRARDFLA